MKGLCISHIPVLDDGFVLAKPNERRYPSDSLEFVMGMLCLDVIIAGLYRPLGATSFDILPLFVLVVSQCLLY